MNHIRWDPCISHRDDAARTFIKTFFADEKRHPLLICGAGFDPRSTETAKLLHAAAHARLAAHFIREDRPNPSPELLMRANGNEECLRKLIARHTLHHVPIFSDDEKTVVAGRRIVEILRKADLSDVTDIIIDLSALSIGVSFPLIRYLFGCAESQSSFPNLHIMVSTSIQMDEAIQTQLMDRYQNVPGFGEDLGLANTARKPKLWLPQLAKRAVPALDLIHRAFDFEEICPIVPFPAHGCRAVEELIEIYQGQITETWDVDDRDFLYAAEDDPLDLYRTILRIDTLRQATYAIEEGSQTVLSPLGTKAMALGALLAALERDLPIIYVEAQRYMMIHEPATEPYGLIHLWLTGEVYPKPHIAPAPLGASACPTSSEPV
jgi:hypothetical protein